MVLTAIDHNIVGPRQKYDDPYRNEFHIFKQNDAKSSVYLWRWLKKDFFIY